MAAFVKEILALNSSSQTLGLLFLDPWRNHPPSSLTFGPLLLFLSSSQLLDPQPFPPSRPLALSSQTLGHCSSPYLIDPWPSPSLSSQALGPPWRLLFLSSSQLLDPQSFPPFRPQAIFPPDLQGSIQLIIHEENYLRSLK